MINFIQSIFTGVIIALVSSWVTIQLSLRKFQKEKLWERKLEAYTKIIASLHNLKECMEKKEYYITGAFREEDQNQVSTFLEDLFSQSNLAQEEVIKYINIGELILPIQAMQVLYKYQQHSNVVYKEIMDEINATWTAANCCINELVPIAKADLRTFKSK